MRALKGAEAGESRTAGRAVKLKATSREVRCARRSVYGTPLTWIAAPNLEHGGSAREGYPPHRSLQAYSSGAYVAEVREHLIRQGATLN